MKEPQVHVGILCEPQIEIIFSSPYKMRATNSNGMQGHRTIVRGKQVLSYDNNLIRWNGYQYIDLLFTPVNEATDYFELLNVTIGSNFHWERKENQRFRGILRIIVEDGKLSAINVLGVEDYLTSVISSEMSATASLELLKAHAVISRSWLMVQVKKIKRFLPEPEPDFTQTDEELIRWYNCEEHMNFDVCADDHCQRYQGITRASTDIVKQAVATTRGQVLTFNGKICDARFSKCCGGVTEEYRYCWEDMDYGYLKTTRDSLCNTTDKKILSQVLNDYDQETTDFFRWKVEYTQQELAEIIRQRSGTDYGEIIDLVPVARGTSGRLWKLKIVGTLRTRIIGKELEIRRTLSPTHLYSSAFEVEKLDISPQGIPGRWVLNGGGWGHGVGLCQIGAAVMGQQGYSYDAILLHYYTGTRISKLY